MKANRPPSRSQFDRDAKSAKRRPLRRQDAWDRRGPEKERRQDCLRHKGKSCRASRYRTPGRKKREGTRRYVQTFRRDGDNGGKPPIGRLAFLGKDHEATADPSD